MLTLRRATLDDAAIIAANNRAMALETEGVTLKPALVDAGVRACLSDPSKGFYLLAERDGAVCGQLMVTYEWSDWRNGVFYWIQSVYVAPDHRRTGVYTALYRHLLEHADAEPSVAGIRLYVHHDNSRAQSAYSALGMAAADYRMFELDLVLER